MQAQGKGYKVHVVAPESVAVGAQASAQIVLVPIDGYKVNREFPTKLKVQAESVTLPKAEQGIAEASSFDEKKGMTFDVPFATSAAGEKHFTATFRFAVCTETTCDPKREDLVWVVKAN